MASSDQDEVYDVERILAERLENGVTRYLVKWQNYPDDQCTWEPAENFDTSETLATWTKQKELGDVLEQDDLQRIQSQMDAFQATLTSTGESEEGHDTSEGDSDVDFDQLQPPKKWLRMVHDPPPLSNRARNLKQPEKGHRKSTSNVKTPSARTPASQVKSSRNPNLFAQASGVTTNTDPPSREVTTAAPPVNNNETVRLPKHKTQTTTTTPPTTFYAPDLNSRKPRTLSTSRPRPRTVIEKPFKNLRHRNNALKKQADKYYVGLTPAAPATSPTIDDNTHHKPAQPPELEPNDSWLFFSDDEMDDVQGSRPVRNDSTTSRNAQSLKSKPDEGANDQVEIKIENRTDGGTLYSVMPLSSVQQPDDVPISVVGHRPAEPHSTTSSLALPPKSAEENQRSNLVDVLQASVTTHPHTEANKLVHGDTNTNTYDSDTMQNSNYPEYIDTPLLVDDRHQGDSMKEVSTARQTEDTLYGESQKSITTTASYRKHDSDIPKLDTQHSRWQLQNTEPTTSAQSARQYVASGDVVRVASGRQWIKGDLVVELFLTNSLAGGIKIENLAWDQRAPIIRLKPKNEHNLPLYFNDVITYDEYRSITAATTWWSTFGAGAVDPFPDSKSTVSSAADYLETNDLAAYWMHPSENLMLILYSCRSPSWQYLHAPLPTRSGEMRLQIICRNKFQVPLPGTHNQPTSIPQDSSPVHNRSPRQRHRRASLLSNSSVNLRDDVNKSPSDQLAREMADYNLDARSRRNSDSLDHTAPEETVQTTASKDSRSFKVHPRSTLAADVSDPVQHDPSELATASPELLQLNVNGHLDRNIGQLSQLPKPIPSRVDRNDIKVLIVHHPRYAPRASAIQEWLSAQIENTGQVITQSTQKGLDDNDYPNWSTFKSWLRSSACVLIYDSPRIATRTDGFAKLLEYDNIVCWQIDLEDERPSPLKTVRVFPTGIAMALTHQCFLVEPSSTILVLQWFKHQAEKPYSASRLILPPNITTEIQEQALLSLRPEIKRCYLDLISLVQELIVLSKRQGDDPLDLGFRLLLPRWEQVYPKTDPTVVGQLTAVEQNHRDVEMSDAFNKYFGAWAVLNLSRHRRFMGVLTAMKPKGHEHVRWMDCKSWAKLLEMKGKAEVEQGSRSRGRSMGRDTASSPDRETRERSRGR